MQYNAAKVDDPHCLHAPDHVDPLHPNSIKNQWRHKNDPRWESVPKWDGTRKNVAANLMKRKPSPLV